MGAWPPTASPRQAAARASPADPGTAVHHTELLRHLLGVVLLRVAGLRPQGNRPGSGPEAFRRFTAELEGSYARTRSVAEYASRLGYATKTLTRACQTATGRTPKDLINDRVTLEAKRLLHHTDLPAAAIAHQLGFAEPSNFAKYFTRETGHSPSAFRRLRGH